MTIIYTDYFRFRVKLRGFDLEKIENIIRYTSERYSDTVTGRRVAVDNMIID